MLVRDLYMTYFGRRFRIRKHTVYQGGVPDSVTGAATPRIPVTYYSVWLVVGKKITQRVAHTLTQRRAKCAAKNWGYGNAYKPAS